MVDVQQQQASRRVRATTCSLYQYAGCSDGGCVYGHPGGMRTNGGCVCIKADCVIELRRHIRRLAAVARALADEVEEARR